MQKLVVVAAGHGTRPDGSFDPGAINPNDGAQEHNYNKIVRDYAIKKLKIFSVVTYSDQNLLGKAKDPNWKGLITYANALSRPPDLVIEIHHDSFNAKPAGFGILPRTLIWPSVGMLATSIEDQYKHLVLATKPSYRDVRGLGLLKIRKYPTLIWECNAIFKTTDDILQKRGEGIAYGIAEWLNLKETVYPFVTYAPSVGLKYTFVNLNDQLVFQNQVGISPNHNSIAAWKLFAGYVGTVNLEPFHFRKMGISNQVKVEKIAV